MCYVKENASLDTCYHPVKLFIHKTKKKKNQRKKIVRTVVRPDILIWSVAIKKAIMIELTLSWKEIIELAYEKSSKNDELMSDCKDKG